MLDPLSAISLAGNIVSFIDFTSEILSESRRIYETGTAKSENLELEGIAERLQTFCVQLGSMRDDGFFATLKTCKQVADELIQTINALNPKDGRHKKWNSFCQALASVWHKDKIRDLQSRLGSLRDQVTFDLMAALCSGQQSLCHKLHTLQKENQHAKVERQKDFARLLEELDKLHIDRSSLFMKADIEQFTDILTRSFSTTEQLSKEMEIIQSLRYDYMLARHSQIAEAYNKTFSWVFNADQLPESDVRAKIGLKSWLESKDGIFFFFWISGKPGSGKSTLMKYIYENPTTMECLQQSAGGSKLNTARFFFWNPGTKMQKSTQGLLQSLLYEILRQCPELIPRVCQQRWLSNKLERSAPWGHEELRRALKGLQGCASASQKFCFFIDGLDEYEDDHFKDSHFELIESMLSIVESTRNIKLCLLSRPWNLFEDAFGSADDRKLYMQDLTENDIEVYSTNKLCLSLPAKWASIAQCQVQKSLATEIVKRAQGVFLWVYLVVHSLQEGLLNGDEISMLQKRLESLPTDLDAYFSHILNSIDNIYQEKLACMLQAALASNEPLSLLTYSFLDEGVEDPEFSIKLARVPLRTAHIKRFKTSRDGESMASPKDF